MGAVNAMLVPQHQVVVCREGENTFAVVSWRSKTVAESEIEGVVRQAVTRWVKQTAEGQAEWEASSEDFNVGDLSESAIPASYFADLDVHDLTINVYSSDCIGAPNWTFDTILMDEDA